jgi:hypothetical protein
MEKPSWSVLLLNLRPKQNESLYVSQLQLPRDAPAFANTHLERKDRLVALTALVLINYATLAHSALPTLYLLTDLIPLPGQ